MNNNSSLGFRLTLIFAIGIVVLLAVIMLLTSKTAKKEPKNPLTKAKNENQGRIVDKNNNVVADIVTESEISGYQVNILNKSELVKTIAGWRLFGIKVGGDPKKTAGFKPITTVKFILADKPQPYYLIGNKNNKLAATAGYDFEGANFLVKVNITKDGLSEPNSYFEEEALRTVFNFTHPWDIKTGEQKQIDAFNAFLKEKNTKKLTYFEVIKK